MPFENTGCGAEVAVSLDRVLRVVEQVLKSGKCEIDWRPLKATKGREKIIMSYGVDHVCLMRELKSRLKERAGGS